MALPLLVASACTTKDMEAPALAGPSELGLSLQLSANPDVLTKDGASQSTIVMIARNADGQPQSGIGLRIETRIGGTLIDYGRLSTKTVTTGSDGRASVVYTAPSGPPAGNSQDDETVLTVRVVPSGSDYSAAVERSVSIRLVPQGVILPPAGRPIAKFSFAPSSPSEGQDVAFDASASVNCPSDVAEPAQCLLYGTKTGLSYAWDFGDGTTGTGVTATHRYHTTGSYLVGLTVTNERGGSDRTTGFVNVGASSRPTASFSFSPTNPEVLQSVFFNASASTAGPGRTLVSYEWTFGDGGRAEGVTVTHRFGTPGSWTVVLTVTDDIGKTGTTQQTISLGADLVPTADFTFSPGDPVAGQTINFDGRLSLPPPGRTLSRWEWSFGDGGTAEGERVSHAYATAGKYSVILTAVDNTGARKSVAKTVEVR